MSQTNHLQVRPENSVHIHPGETLTLQCREEGNEGEQHKYKEMNFFLQHVGNTNIQTYSVFLNFTQIVVLIAFAYIIWHLYICSVDCIYIYISD